MKKLDSKAASIGANHNPFEGDDRNNNQGISQIRHSPLLGTPSEKQSYTSLRTGALKSACGSIIKTNKIEIDETELLKDNFWTQTSVDLKDKQIIAPDQLNSQQKKRGIRVQSNHQFPSDFFSNQICKTETSTISRQPTSQPSNRLPSFQTSSNPMKLSLPLPSDQQVRCQTEKHDLSFDQLPASKTNQQNNSSSKGYLIRQMYPQNMHQYAQSISSLSNIQQNNHIFNSNGKADKNIASLNQQQQGYTNNRMLSPKERPWRILSPKEGTSIMVSPRLRPLRILSPKEANLTTSKTSLICNSQKSILKPYLGQTSNPEDLGSYSSGSLEKSKPHERQREQQQAAFFIQKQNSCKIGLGGKRIMSMIDSKPPEKIQIFNEFLQSKPTSQDANKNHSSNSIASCNIVPSISRQNILSGKGSKPNPVDFTNFKMPLSSIGKKIKNFQIPEKTNQLKQKDLDQQQQKSFRMDDSIPKIAPYVQQREDNERNINQMNLPQLKLQSINDEAAALSTNFFSQAISRSPFTLMNTSNAAHETIEEDFQFEDSEEKQYAQQYNQDEKIENNKTANFSSGWNSNSGNSNKKDQPRLAVNSKISDKYKPFLIRQVSSSQSSQRAAQQSASISTNTSATAASLTMFCSDLIKNSDVILKNPSLTAPQQQQLQQQPTLNSIECYNSHEFSFSNN